MALDLSCAWDSYMKQRLGSARHPRRISSPATIKIASPERQGGHCAPTPEEGTCSDGSPPAEERPDPCAKDTVLRALSQCKKGKWKFDGPLWFETPESSCWTRGPQPRPSAFKPLVRDGPAPPFVPRPGSLDRASASGPAVSARSSSVCRPPCGAESVAPAPGSLVLALRNLP